MCWTPRARSASSGNLISREHRDGYLAQTLADQQAARDTFAGKRRERKMLTIDEARKPPHADRVGCRRHRAATPDRRSRR